MRKEAGHTQRQDRASGVLPDILHAKQVLLIGCCPMPPLLCGQLGFVTSDNWAKECQLRCSEVGSFILSTGTMFFQPRHNHAFESKLLSASGRTTENDV